MWLIPFVAGQSHTLSVDLGPHGCSVAGVSVWNYNKSADDVLRGAKSVVFFADERCIGRWEFRQAPGIDGNDQFSI